MTVLFKWYVLSALDLLPNDMCYLNDMGYHPYAFQMICVIHIGFASKWRWLPPLNNFCVKQCDDVSVVESAIIVLLTVSYHVTRLYLTERSSCSLSYGSPSSCWGETFLDPCFVVGGGEGEGGGRFISFIWEASGRAVSPYGSQSVIAVRSAYGIYIEGDVRTRNTVQVNCLSLGGPAFSWLSK